MASKNRTFYDWSVSGGADQSLLERRYPPLDLVQAEPNPEYLGVTVVRGGVHLSRPKTWVVREASNEPGRAFIQYLSPHAYLFAIYERVDSPQNLWGDIMSRYEEDVGAVGATLVGRRVPVATWRSQGRAYEIERKVDAVKGPLTSHSHEILLRGDHRIVLVQIVHEGDTLSEIDGELMRVMATLDVL